jgi:hypothetical protein
MTDKQKKSDFELFKGIVQRSGWSIKVNGILATDGGKVLERVMMAAMFAVKGHADMVTGTTVTITITKPEPR